MIAPLRVMTVTSPYGVRVHPVTRDRSFHNGVDLRAKLGTEVRAPFAGRLTLSETKAGGKQAFVTHSTGLRAGFAHLSGYAKGYAPGDNVPEGAVIAYTGQSGIGTGPHLHFTMALVTPEGDTKRFDPMAIEWEA